MHSRLALISCSSRKKADREKDLSHPLRASFNDSKRLLPCEREGSHGAAMECIPGSSNTTVVNKTGCMHLHDSLAPLDFRVHLVVSV